MQRPYTSAIAALVILFSVSIPSLAETTPENAIKYRHAIMEAMAGHTAAFSMIAFGMVDRPEYLVGHADALAEAGQELSTLFPESSGEGDTHALPAIWDEPDKFAKAVTATEKATAELVAAAAGGDRKAISTAFKAVGAACKGCHEDFRAEHDH